MRNWECGICEFIHKEEGPPEKCPVCDAPGKMFKERIEEPRDGAAGAEAGTAMKTWQCSVCGHFHTGTVPPDNCPVCDAPGNMFEAKVEGHKEKGGAKPTVEKRWRCIVCGYIHTGAEPPDKCPVCAAPRSMFEEIDQDGKVIGEPASMAVEMTVPAAVGKKEEDTQPSSFDRLAGLAMKLHLHHIMVHFPNGVLPVAVTFLIFFLLFNILSLEVAAHYNLIAVLVMMPFVLFSGYLEWQKRYKGVRTALFITKILCGLAVLAATNVLVFWRLLDPGVMADGSPMQMIYFGIAAGTLGVTGFAGYLGGRLTFGSRG